MATVFINEIHYDNPGADAGEAVEIAGPAGTDLSGWSLVLYNGNGGAPYSTAQLTGTIPDQDGGFGTLSFPATGLQNGSPDGVALVDPAGSVAQFLRYEGVFTAVGGPANGLASADIGVSETGSEPGGQSLRLTGSGDESGDFAWAAPAAASFGEVNAGQDFGGGGSGGGGSEPPPVPAARIPEIQGAAHASPLVGQTVATGGVVTAVDSNGFYLQDAAGDGNTATSDAVFVFTGGAPTVAVGDAVTLRGTVSEFVPGGASSNNLSTTQITSPTGIAVASSGNALPAPVVIGEGGRRPPSEVIEDDGFASFDPETDGTDFFESLEAMRVTVRDAVAVGPTTDFGEIYTVADGGAGATNLIARGTVNIEGGSGGPTVTNTLGGDFNPERVQIDDDAGLLPGFATPEVSTGARLGPVTGVVGFAFGQFEVLATEPYAVVQPSALQPETGDLRGGADALTVATYNVLNLDQNDADGSADVADGQFAAVAAHIARSLNAPDIVGLQEIQDNDGASNTAVTSASLTLQTLAEAIAAAGGPRYSFVDNPFITDDETGGEPGGNIRTAFLYRDDRVDLVDGSLRTVTDPADQATNPDNPFADSRLPLAADFTFSGETVTVVANHFTSKGGSAPLLGAVQPPTNGGEPRRLAQAEAVNAFVDGLLGADASANVVVLGDLNEFEFEEPIRALEGADGALQNLTNTLPEDERYSYVFEGNSQSLDHILASANLAAVARFDAVHVNSEFADNASDHDPLLARFDVAGQALSGGNGADSVAGGGFADTLSGGNSADTLSGGGGADSLSGDNGGDLLRGGSGADTLSGGNAADTLEGGAGADVLEGGSAADRFVFGPGGGDDIVPDFAGGDRLALTGGLSVAGIEERDADGDGAADTVVLFGDGGTVALLGVAGVAADAGSLFA